MRMLYRPALLVVVIGMLASCGSSPSTTPSTPPSSSNPNVGLANVEVPSSQGYGASSFVPGAVTIPVGGAVSWTSNDTIEHHPTADDGSWNDDLPAMGSASQKFTTAGTYSYHCSIHPSMTGTITVTGSTTAK
jgi:plastocyanin